MGYTIHQTLVDLTSKALTFTAYGSFFATFVVINRNFATHCLCDKLFCFADSVCYLRHDHRFTIESCHSDIFICCNDDTVTCCDFFCSQHILISTGTICLNFDRITHLFCFIFQTLRCHVCVCDSSRTCRNCKDLVACFFCRFFFPLFFLFCFIRKFCFFCCINISKKFLY